MIKKKRTVQHTKSQPNTLPLDKKAVQGQKNNNEQHITELVDALSMFR